MLDADSVKRSIRAFLVDQVGPAAAVVAEDADLAEEEILDSLQILELMTFVETAFGVPPSERLLMDEAVLSIRALTDEVLRSTTS